MTAQKVSDLGNGKEFGLYGHWIKFSTEIPVILEIRSASFLPKVLFFVRTRERYDSETFILLASSLLENLFFSFGLQ